ncbi:MAG: response regulator transcription factor [Lachnospira sp.]|jgi:DNA-binding response OmpR family regulator|nr:response regulator transcription factor [Lachnospira sp.]
MSEKVLIVDDDPAICKMLSKVMDSNNLESDIANSGTAALALIENHSYDVILMDVTMDDMEGFDVIKKIRSNGVSTPVIIISGRSEDYDALYGLSVGADDYITKPFRPLIVGAKVKALIRRNKQQIMNSNDIIICGDLKYDTTTLRFYKNDEEIDLSSKENNLMLLFMKHPDQVFTKDMIYEHVWGNSVIVDDNTIMVYINRLRNKIEDNPQKPVHIQTVRGTGYRFHA